MLVTGGTFRTPEGEPERDGDRGQQGLRQERASNEEGISRCTAGMSAKPASGQPSQGDQIGQIFNIWLLFTWVFFAILPN